MHVVYHEPPSYEHFFKNVMSKNILCTLPGELTSDWKCRKYWVTREGTIDFDYLANNYGHMECPVYKCNETYFNSNPASSITLREYIQYWKEVIACDHRYQENQKDILYLKDWHLFCDESAPPDVQELFELPTYFGDDYLNDYCCQKKLTDYKFVYLGPKGSSTPLHTDVFGSYSWSANICGRKRWLFIPECNVPKLRRLLGDQLPQSLYKLDNFAEICEQTEAFEIIQNVGEIIFVPSGYMHEVLNVEDTISINHNWFNSCNLHHIYQALCDAYHDVQSEIGHLKDQFDDHEEWLQNCDKMLTIHFGMNFETFTNILENVLEKLEHNQLPSHSEFHCEDDVRIVKSILLKIKQNKTLQ